LEYLRQIQKRHPVEFRNPDILLGFFADVLYLLDRQEDHVFAFPRGPVDVAVAERFVGHVKEIVARIPASRADGALPWLWREYLRTYRAAVTLHPARSAHAVRLNADSLKLIRDWYVSTRPDILRYSWAEAAELANTWEITQEVKRTRRALQQALPAFPRVYLKGPWGEWRLREPESTPLAPVQAIGGMLGHCYSHLHWAQRYGDGGRMFVLISKDGWPQATLTQNARGHMRELKGTQNALIDPNHPAAAASQALLKKLYGRDLAAWGEDARSLFPWPVDAAMLLRLWEADSDALLSLALHGGAAAEGLAASLVDLLENTDEHLKEASRNGKLEWGTESSWPQDKDRSEWNWLKPYRLPKGVAPLILQIELTQSWDEFEMGIRDYVYTSTRESNSDWDELEDAVEDAGDDLNDEFYEASQMFEESPWPKTVRTRQYQVGIDYMDGDVKFRAEVDLRRVVRDFPQARQLDRLLRDVLYVLERQVSYLLGDDRRDSEYASALSIAADHALDYLRLKYLDRDPKGAQKMLTDFQARHPYVPQKLGRSNRRRAHRPRSR